MVWQSEHDGSDVQEDLNVEHLYDTDIVPNMTRTPRVKYITYYEDSESLPGKRTAVWEVDKGALTVSRSLYSVCVLLLTDHHFIVASHRNIVRSPVLMRELWLQMWHDIHPDAKSKFVTKGEALYLFFHLLLYKVLYAHLA